jgi:hypothetical protein
MLKELGVKCTVKTGGKRLQSMDLSAAMTAFLLFYKNKS